jgi:predicted HicB family RNase H-like nuclease
MAKSKKTLKRERLAEEMVMNIRGVPTELVRKARIRGLREGLSLKAFVIRTLEQAVKESK